MSFAPSPLSGTEPPRDCPRCPRLAAVRTDLRAEHPAWWNAPVPAWGDPEAWLAIIGLAPGKQGANRTGRPFTGDFAGQLLFDTLGEYGLATGAYAGTPDDGLAHPLADSGDASWVAAGVRGALEWGAPIVATSDLPVDLYLPTDRDVRRVAARHAGGEGTEVRLAADPNGFVRRDARQVSGLAWPLALPLFCALDLTASARDREALDQWTPPEPFTRVW